MMTTDPMPAQSDPALTARLAACGVVLTNGRPPAPHATIGPCAIPCHTCGQPAGSYYGKAGPLVDDLTNDHGNWTRVACRCCTTNDTNPNPTNDSNRPEPTPGGGLEESSNGRPPRLAPVLHTMLRAKRTNRHDWLGTALCAVGALHV